MHIDRALWLPVAVASLSGCVAVGSRSAVNAVTEQFTDTEVPPAACSDGEERVAFIMEALPALPPADSLNLPPPKAAMPPLVAPKTTDTLRLEVCVDAEEHLRLLRAVSKRGVTYNIFSLPASAEVAGLEEALLR